MFTMSDLEFDGDKLTISIWSSTLPVVHIDTYSTFTGDSSYEMELEYLIEEDNADPDSFDTTWDMPAIRRELAESSIQYVLETVDREIIHNVELTDTYAPKEYNFKTDAYDAKYTVSASKLQAWAESVKFDVDAYVREFHESYDGFISFVPNALERDREAMTWFLTIAAYLRETLDGGDHDEYVYDSVDEIYSTHRSITFKTLGESAASEK